MPNVKTNVPSILSDSIIAGKAQKRDETSVLGQMFIEIAVQSFLLFVWAESWEPAHRFTLSPKYSSSSWIEYGRQTIFQLHRNVSEIDSWQFGCDNMRHCLIDWKHRWKLLGNYIMLEVNINDVFRQSSWPDQSHVNTFYPIVEELPTVYLVSIYHNLRTT